MYSKQSVYFTDVEIDRRNHNGDGVPVTGLNNATALAKKQSHAKDLNIDGRITKFNAQLKNYVYRMPLRYFTDLGKINFPTKIDYRIKLFLETNMKKLFESRKLLATGSAIPSPDVQIIFTKASYVPIFTKAPIVIIFTKPPSSMNKFFLIKILDSI